MSHTNIYSPSHADLFAAAVSQCVVRGKNNNPGVDADTENVERGICSGITSAWLAALLSAGKDPSATEVTGFSDAFDNLIRFQGAYLRELHGKADVHLAALRGHLGFDFEELEQVQCRQLQLDDLPEREHWGAYVSLRGHAVGVGRFNGRWMIMDPNLGLFLYPDAQGQAMVDDLNHLTASYWQRKGLGEQTQMLLQVFEPL